MTTYFLEREKETSLVMRLDVSEENVFSLSSFLDINKVLGNDFVEDGPDRSLVSYQVVVRKM